MNRRDGPSSEWTRADGTPATGTVVFTDLDGTLLDHASYSWAPARAALARLDRLEIPLVIASSKTRPEIEAWRLRLNNHAPFISENGGALYVPPGATPVPIAGGRPAFGYLRAEFGAPYARLREALGLVSRELAVPLRGFGDMSDAEITRCTGLTGEELQRARLREYDEPFLPARALTDDEESELEARATALGLRVTRGGRLRHLIGPSSKGAAARRLLEAYSAGGRKILSIALGDGANDLELLRVVDLPVVVARPDGTHTPALRQALPGARFTTGVGPAGFREAILEYTAHWS
jgi:mannosyl-3-phosphoglycerate phosphatase